MYVKTNWLERVRQFANRFTLTATANPGEFDVVRVEGTVSQAGVPLSISNLQKIEDELERQSLEIESPSYSTSATSSESIVSLPSTARGELSAVVSGRTAINLAGLGDTSPQNVASLDATKTYLLLNSLGVNVEIDTVSTATPVKITGEVEYDFVWASGKIALIELSTAEALLTAAELVRTYSYFENTKSTDAHRFVSEGKQLFNKASVTNNFSVNASTGALTASTTKASSDFIKISPSISYVTSASDTYAYYDSVKTFISGGTGTALTTPSNALWVRVTVANTAIDTFQLELGSTATTYEAYKADQSICDKPLRNVPAIADEFDYVTGKHTQKIKVKTLIEADIISVTNLTNVTYAKVTKPSDSVGSGNTSTNGWALLDGFIETTAAIDNTDAIGKFRLDNETTNIRVVFAFGTSLADAKTALIGLDLQYAMTASNYVVTETRSNVINAYASGRYRQEPFVADYGFFNSGLALVKEPTKLISNLVEVRKWDLSNGDYTIIPLADVTVTAGLITAITGAVDGEFYSFDYNYADAFVNGSIASSHGINTSAQVEANRTQLSALDKKVDNNEIVAKAKDLEVANNQALQEIINENIGLVRAIDGNNYRAVIATATTWSAKLGETEDYGGTVQAIVADKNAVYAGGATVNVVKKYNKITGILEVTSAVFVGTINAMAQDNDFIYAENGTTVRKLNKSDLSLVGETIAHTSGLSAVLVDDDYLYSGGLIENKIKKWDKNTLALVAESPNYGSLVLCMGQDNTHIYVGGGNTNRVRKYLKSDMSFVQESADYGVNIVNIAVSESNVYIVGLSSTSVTQLLKSDLSTLGTTATYGGVIKSLAADDTHFYAAGATTNTVRRYLHSTRAFVDATASYGNTIEDIAIDENSFHIGGVTVQTVQRFGLLQALTGFLKEV